jgi:hypothetical protein
MHFVVWQCKDFADFFAKSYDLGNFGAGVKDSKIRQITMTCILNTRYSMECHNAWMPCSMQCHAQMLACFSEVTVTEPAESEFGATCIFFLL